MEPERRNFLKYAVGGGFAVLGASCAYIPKAQRDGNLTQSVAPVEDTRATLPSNTGEFREGYVDASEDKSKIQLVGLLDDWYYKIPLNNKTRKLKGGDPIFGIIPFDKGRLRTTGIGVAGYGENIVDTPNGDFYLPYIYSTDGPTWEKTTDYSKLKPVRFVTNKKISQLKKPDILKTGKITFRTLTEEDIPFGDETLLDGQPYVINRICDKDVKADKDVLPIYFTKLPLTRDRDPNRGDGKLRLWGETFIFSRHLSLDEYIQARGITNPVLEEQNTIQRLREEEYQNRIKEESIHRDVNQNPSYGAIF
ncbi:MAG: hypothetical protein ABIB79_01925 [archaeon]